MMMMVMKGMRGQAQPCLPALHNLLCFSLIIYLRLLIIDCRMRATLCSVIFGNTRAACRLRAINTEKFGELR